MTETTETTTPLANRSPTSIAVDNMMRRMLRVADPTDPSQISTALLQRYGRDAELVRREREGLPFASTSAPAPAPTVAPTGSAAVELAQASDDLQRDVDALVGNSVLKDIRVELNGWGRALRQAATNGLASARQSLDVTQFNRAMAARRTLGDYARLSRYVGALTPDCAFEYRSLARSCDTMGALILVGVGDGLASGGVTRSTSLMRVAAGELQGRRNAVINTFRTLTGSVETSLGQEDWPRGIEAFRMLTQRLDREGQADLRALLEESALTNALDELVDLTSGGAVANLRELSTAGAMLIYRLQRLIQYGQGVPVPANANIANGSPESPPFQAFVSALQLFVDAFTPTSGMRLLDISRPALLMYGLYGSVQQDPGALRLMQLVDVRNLLAEQIDCVADCNCVPATAPDRVMLDRSLYDLDRAIDYYALSSSLSIQSEPEARAAACGMVIANYIQNYVLNLPPNVPQLPLQTVQQLWAAAALLIQGIPNPPIGAHRRLVLQELESQFRAERRLEDLARSLSPGCANAALTRFFQAPVVGWVSFVRTWIGGTYAGLNGNVWPLDIQPPARMPPPEASSDATMAYGRPGYWQF